MRMKWFFVLPIVLLLFSPCVPVVATCEGDPPGHPFCYECKDGVWVLRSFAQCGQDSDCTGECHDGCPPHCLCEIDASKCIGDCNSCLPFAGWCYDDPRECPGECDSCIHGNCEDIDSDCDDCETCLNGSCDPDCSPTQTCCNDTCCNSGNCCNNTTCCTNSNDVCCTDSGDYCCQHGETCCQGNCCEIGQICCGDGSCEWPCDEEFDQSICSSEDDTPCTACVGIFGDCSVFNTFVSTNVLIYECFGGCPGDCDAEEPQPVCIRWHICEDNIYFLFASCCKGGEIVRPLDCYGAEMPWGCTTCKKGALFLEVEGDSYRCQ